MANLFMKTRRFKAAVLTTVVAFTLASCATTGQGGGGVSRTVLQGCAGGAALGALTGALLSKDNRVAGGVIGGLAGAAVGCTVGGAFSTNAVNNTVVKLIFTMHKLPRPSL